MCNRWASGSIVAAGLFLLANGQSTLAAVVYDSQGFESPTFTSGNLAGQDGGKWQQFGPGGTNTAVVQSTTVFQGSQAVKVTRTSGDMRYAPNTAAVTPSAATGSRYVLVDWNMNVTKSTGATFGPFAGIEAYDPSVKLLGGAGVDSTTGELLFEDPSAGGDLTVTASDFTVPFGTWHHYTLAFDFQLHQYSVLVDGTVQLTTSGSTFVDETKTGDITQFSDADISSLAAASEPPVQTGVAYFDGYSVSTANSVPEPATMALMGVAGLGLIGRPRRGRKTTGDRAPVNDR